MICLDTNAVIGAINRRVPSVRKRLEAALIAQMTVGIPAIVLYELWYGIKKSARPQANAAALTIFLGLDVTLWPVDPQDAEEAADVRATLERAGTPIGPYDVLIAGQARRRNAVLITANIAEFSRVPRLKTEDWTVPT